MTGFGVAMGLAAYNRMRELAAKRKAEELAQKEKMEEKKEEKRVDDISEKTSEPKKTVEKRSVKTVASKR